METMAVDRKYEKNNLTNVLFKVDFIKLSNEVIFNNDFFNVVNKHFPVIEKDELIASGQILIDMQDGNPQQPIINNEILIKKNLSNPNNESRISYNTEFLGIELKKYNGYESIKPIIEDILNNLFIHKNKNISVRRIGLRFINHYDLSKYKSLNKYFNKDLLSALNIGKSLTSIQQIRALSRLEFSFNESKLNFQYGLYNPDYPAVINKQYYVLDYDCYFEGVLDDPDKIIKKIDENHKMIQYVFENSINDQLRKEMIILE